MDPRVDRVLFLERAERRGGHEELERDEPARGEEAVGAFFLFRARASVEHSEGLGGEAGEPGQGTAGFPFQVQG